MRSQKSLRSSEGAKADDSMFWIHSKQADLFFGMWIVLNSLVLAVETDARDDSDNAAELVWFTLDSIFNVVFLVEMLMRIYAEQRSWLKSGWNVFDFFLVSVGIIDTWILTFTGSGALDVSIVAMLRILRLMRLLRLLRVFRMCKELMLIIVGIASAMRAMVWGLAILAITIFMCALLLTRLVGKSSMYTDPFYNEYFGSMPRTAFTLLQFTMEFQPDICRQSWQDGTALTLFFIVYTCFTNLTILNIIGSIIVDTIMTKSSDMNIAARAKAEAEKDREQAKELRARFASVDADNDGALELQEVTRSSSFSNILESVGLDMHYAQEFFEVLDTDGSGRVSVEEFIEGVMRVQKPPQAKHLLQVERRLVAMDLKVKDSMDLLLTLLRQPNNPADQGRCLQREPAPTSHVPDCGQTQDITKMMLRTLQSERESMRNDLTVHMEDCRSRICDLHMAVVTCFEALKHTHRTDGNELRNSSSVPDNCCALLLPNEGANKNCAQECNSKYSLIMGNNTGCVRSRDANTFTI